MITKPDIQRLVKVAEQDASRPLVPSRYDAAGVEYVNARTKVQVVCAEHGPFLILPRDIERRSYLSIYPFDLDKLVHVCTDCRDEALRERNISMLERFTEKARAKHGSRYDYSQVDYQGANTKVSILCPEHGAFQQTPGSHLFGRGCPACGKRSMSEKKRTR